MSTLTTQQWLSALALTAFSCTSSLAQQDASTPSAVTAVKVSSQDLKAGTPVTLTLDFNTAQPWCGLEIQWGDGQQNVVSAGPASRNASVQMTHIYQAPGQFTLHVAGRHIARGLKSANPCGGLPMQAVVVIEPGPVKTDIEKNRPEGQTGR